MRDLRARGSRPGRKAPPAGWARRGILLGAAGGAAGVLAAACAPGESPAPAPSQREKTVIFDTDWLGGVRGDVVNAALAEWSKQNPKIRIDKRDVLAASGSVFDKTSTLIASDSLGDIMLWAGYVFTYYAKRGLLLDVGPYLKKYRINLDDRYYIPQHIIYNGKTYGFPWQYNAFDWLYNRSLFRNKGLKEPDETWTWETVLAAAQKLGDPSNNIYGLAAPGGYFTPAYFHTLLFETGGEERSKDDTKTLFDSPQGVDAITYSAELATKYKVAPLPKDATALKLTPAMGNYAMWIGSASRAFDAQVAGKFEWDLMYAPTWPKTGKRVVTRNDQPHVITTAAQKHDVVEEAALFGAFLSGDFVQGVVARIGDTFPVYKKAADTDDFLPASKWKRKVITDGFNYRRVDQGYEWWYSWYSAVQPELLKATNGEVSPLDAARSATRAGDTAIAAGKLDPSK